MPALIRPTVYASLGYSTKREVGWKLQKFKSLHINLGEGGET